MLCNRIAKSIGLVAAISALFLSRTAIAAEYFVAPDGKSPANGGDGSVDPRGI